MTMTSNLRWVEDDPVTETALPADDPRGFFAVIAEIVAYMAARCALVLPELDVSRSLPYVLALHWHAWQGDEESYAALLAAEPYDDRHSADDALYPGTVHQEAPAYGWLEPDTATSRVPDRATHKRADGTVRGRDMIYVVGDDGDGIYRRMPAGECLARAAMWNIATGRTVPDLIGTETTAWAQVVNYSPDTLTTVAGVTFANRPERDPHEMSVGDARKRIAYRARTAQYHPRPDLEYLPWSHFLATGERVVKRYRTRFLVANVTETAPTVATYRPRVVRLGRVATGADPRYVDAYAVRESISERRYGPIVRTGSVRLEWIGHTVTRRTSTVQRAHKPTGRTVAKPVDVATDQIRVTLESAFTTPELPHRYRTVRADGTTVTVTVDRAHRRYCVTVKHADKTTARRNARTINAAMTAVTTL